jgi:hypothetical protein
MRHTAHKENLGYRIKKDMEQTLISLVDAVVRDCYGQVEGLGDGRAFDADQLRECPARLAAYWCPLRIAFGTVEVRQLAQERLETAAECVQLLRGLLKSLSRRTRLRLVLARYPGTRRLPAAAGQRSVTQSHCLWRITCSDSAPSEMLRALPQGTPPNNTTTVAAGVAASAAEAR